MRFPKADHFMAVLAATLFLISTARCGRPKAPPPAPAEESVVTEEPAPPPEPARIDTGALAGRVVLAAKPPPNPRIRMTSDPACRRAHGQHSVVQEIVAVDDRGGLRNVFVYLSSGPALRRSYPPPADPVVLDQTGCLFRPRVFGLQVGQALRAVNSDPTLHNVHAFSSAGNGFNTAQPVQGMESEFRLKSPEVMMKIKCDVHPWMVAYAGVLPHPFFTVSDEHGRFRIPGVPPGRYQVTAWHEYYGVQTASAYVEPGQTAEVTFTYPSAQ